MTYYSTTFATKDPNFYSFALAHKKTPFKFYDIFYFLFYFDITKF